MKGNNDKILFLQGLKGIMAIVVVIFHFLAAFFPVLVYGDNSNSIYDKISKSFFNIFYDGNLAVSFFFLIGAYVVSYKVFSGENLFSLKKILKKYIRFLIPVSVSIFFAYTCIKFNLFYNKNAAIITGSKWLDSFYNFTPSHLLLILECLFGSLILGINNYNPTLWTMRYEFLGAFLVFIVLLVINVDFKKRYLFYLFFIIVLLIIDSRYLAFIYGIIIADLNNSGDNILKKYIRKKYILFILLFVGLYLASSPDAVFIDAPMYSILWDKNNDPLFWHNIGAALLLICIFNSSYLKLVLSKKFFVNLGNLSFSIYLMHFWILNSFSSFLFVNLFNYFNYFITFMITLFLTIIVIYIISKIFYRFIDKLSIDISNLIMKI